jgi:hypothetical protein
LIFIIIFWIYNQITFHISSIIFVTIGAIVMKIAWKGAYILDVNDNNIFYVIGWVIGLVVGVFNFIYNYNKNSKKIIYLFLIISQFQFIIS